MAREEIKKDIMMREYTRLSYTDFNGRTSVVIKYDAGYSPQLLRQSRYSEEPIYVAFEGEQPEELSNVLEELRRYRTNTKLETDKLHKEVRDLEEEVRELQLFAKKTNKKRWWHKND